MVSKSISSQGRFRLQARERTARRKPDLSTYIPTVSAIWRQLCPVWGVCDFWVSLRRRGGQHSALAQHMLSRRSPQSGTVDLSAMLAPGSVDCLDFQDHLSLLINLAGCPTSAQQQRLPCCAWPWSAPWTYAQQPIASSPQVSLPPSESFASPEHNLSRQSRLHCR